ncbi:phosphotransferase [Paenibacillus pabuli]|uniref:phosphotransferase enzyme family protein n=1 Tax=Paenibacillus pabuli TaxID=1472 RepID=UPI0032424644
MNCKFDEVIRHYFKEPEYTLDAVPFGLTNTTKIIDINGQRFIVRIYNIHIKTIDGLKLESRVTAFLHKAQASFEVPIFLHTYDGKDYVVMRDGSLAAMTTFLEGKLPQLSNIEKADKFGRLVGGFSFRMSEFPMKKNTYTGISFHKLYNIHPLANRDSVISFFADMPFELTEQRYTFYQTMITEIENSKLNLEVLPQQLVHHDLLIYNLLGQSGEITGVLDFDFIGMDAALMELTISLNHIIQESNGSLNLTEAFLQGYGDTRKHSSLELGYVQLLTQIYFIAVLHFYIGQHYAGFAIEHPFTFMIDQFERNISWLTENDVHIQQFLHRYVTETNTTRTCQEGL